VTGDPPTRLYEHKKTGASIMLPPFPDDNHVLEYHLVTARVMLDEYGIAEPTVFAAKLQKAGLGCRRKRIILRSVPKRCGGTFPTCQWEAVVRDFGTLKTCRHRLREQTLDAGWENTSQEPREARMVARTSLRDVTPCSSKSCG